MMDIIQYYCQDGVIDLPALNRQRKKLSSSDDASKVTIYVDENLHVETKGAHLRTDFSMID